MLAIWKFVLGFEVKEVVRLTWWRVALLVVPLLMLPIITSTIHSQHFDGPLYKNAVRPTDVAYGLYSAWPANLTVSITADADHVFKSTSSYSYMIDAVTNTMSLDDDVVRVGTKFKVAVAADRQTEEDALNMVVDAPCLILGPTQYSVLNLFPWLHGKYTSRPYTIARLNSFPLAVCRDIHNDGVWHCIKATTRSAYRYDTLPLASLGLGITIPQSLFLFFIIASSVLYFKLMFYVLWLAPVMIIAITQVTDKMKQEPIKALRFVWFGILEWPLAVLVQVLFYLLPCFTNWVELGPFSISPGLLFIAAQLPAVILFFIGKDIMRRTHKLVSTNEGVWPIKVVPRNKWDTYIFGILTFYVIMAVVLMLGYSAQVATYASLTTAVGCWSYTKFRATQFVNRQSI